MRRALLLSLWLGAIVLVPSGAHVLEMTAKLAMDRADYFTAQRIYLGWALFGVPIIVKIVLDATLAFLLRRRDRRAALGALASSVLIAAGLAAFFALVQPANVATANWAVQVPDWEALRSRWEFGHLAVAVLTALAFGAISLAAIAGSVLPPHRDDEERLVR
jgi:hypothetical protein